MLKLSETKCTPCEQLTPDKILTTAERAEFMKQLQHWKIAYNNRLRKVFTLPNFASAIKFVNDLAQICEQQNHHPRIYIFKGNKVRVDFSTFIVGRDLTINDFIMAARADRLGT